MLSGHDLGGCQVNNPCPRRGGGSLLKKVVDAKGLKEVNCKAYVG